MIYLDHAASTQIVESSLNIFTESLVMDFSNPSASHKLGKSTMKKVDKARAQILKLLKAKSSDQFIFVSSATEANNLIIKGINLDSSSRVHFSLGDHPSTIEPVKSLDVKHIQIPILKGGRIDEEALLASLDVDSRLIILCHVNNQSGVINDVVNLAKKIKLISPQIHVHIDGVQALSKIEVNLSSAIDSYTVSGHKIGAPKGIGGLFLKGGVVLNTQLHGGGHEFGLRSSTVNAPLVLSFVEAVKFGIDGLKTSFVKVSGLNSHLRERLAALDLGLRFPFLEAQCSPYILCFLLPEVSSDIVMRHLEVKEIFVSSSSACSSRSKGYSPSFDAMKINEKDHKFVLRVSFSKSTSVSEIDVFIDELAKTISHIKNI